MDDQPENDRPATPLDPISALSQIHDDESVIHEARRWAAEEMISGRTPEDLLAQMLTDGWETDQAEQIIETARQQTREARGVVTRTDIVRDLNVDYRRATGGVSVAFRSGLFGLYGFTTGFMAALRSARKLKSFLKRNRVNSQDQNQE